MLLIYSIRLLCNPLTPRASLGAEFGIEADIQIA